MKPETNIQPAERVYYAKHRAHCVRFLIALVILSWTIIGSFLAVIYGLTMPAIWLVLASMFFTLVSVVEFKAADAYYDKFLDELAREFRGLPPIDYPN